MNYRIIFNTLGKVMLIGALIFALPLLVGLIYKEDSFLSFIIPMLILGVVGSPLTFIKVKDRAMFAREGFVIVALCWIVLSFSGCLPFIISGAIPNFMDALFETVSGLTTTGASILSSAQTDVMYQTQKAIMFWRIFTHWIGGMGVLVFVLALFPTLGDGAIYLYKAESPGPSSSKLVSKIVHTARILYGLYIALTVIEIVLLLFSNIGVYDSVLCAFSTAGTGGFALHGEGIAFYNSNYVEIVLAIFMFLFGINFNVYYFILVGSVTKVFKNEELRTYVIMVIVATFTVTLNILNLCASFGEALRYAFFQVASISSTTGLTTANFDAWPSYSKAVLFVLMIFGGCAGSTAGGMKISRLMVMCKSGLNDIKKMVHPRAVYSIKLEGEVVSKDAERNIRSYFIVWFLITLICTLLLSIDAYCHGDLLTSFSSTLACIGNVGPGFNGVGPTLTYAGFSDWSKGLLCLVMLAGRLEIFPMIILFSPTTWRKGR